MYDNDTKMPKDPVYVFIASTPPPKKILLDGKRNTVSTNYVVFEITITAPQRMEIRVIERMWYLFCTWGATSVKISWNFRNFGFRIWHWIHKISSQKYVPGHNGPTNTISKYFSSDRRAEIKIISGRSCAIYKNITKMPETPAQVFVIRRPPPRRVLFDGKRNTVSTSHAIFEITLTAPQGIEIRVSERIFLSFCTWGATSVNNAWNFRNFEFCIWPWIRKI